MEIFLKLAVALAVGLLMGLERGWHERGAGEGERIAGLRTFGLIALLGALWGMLAEQLGEFLLGFGFAGFAALVVASYLLSGRHERSVGVTTEVAMLLTFALGAVSAGGHMSVAAAVAVVAATLLGLKPVLHGWLLRLEQGELYAIFKLLLISVVLLPVLPDRGYGPWDTLNPHKLWWMVVLIAGISFVGYFAVKLAGARRGLVLTALFAGLASSTALTLSFARIGRHSPGLQPLLAAGVVIAAATMFPRVLLEVSVVNPDLLPALTVPLGAMTLLGFAAVPVLLRRGSTDEEPHEVPLSNPFELLPALKFAALLVAVLLLSKAAEQWLGEAGVYLLAAVSGLSDVDAITLSLAQLARGDLAAEVAVRGIVVAAMVNTAVKAVLVVAIARGVMGRRVGFAVVMAVLGGAVGLVAVV